MAEAPAPVPVEPTEETDQAAPGDAAEIRQSARGAWQSSSDHLSRGSWSPTLSPPRRPRNAGGFLAGLALYITAITYIRYGPTGWKGWLAAKFINQPMTKSELNGVKATPKPSTKVQA
jgi:hypothetical protein